MPAAEAGIQRRTLVMQPASLATSNASFDYWRSNHRERKDHKIGAQKEMIGLTASCYAKHLCQHLALTPSLTPWTPAVVPLDETVVEFDEDKID
jgi:hypothetical protein